MQVKKHICRYQADSDLQLQKTFKNHAYVGLLTADQILIQFDTKLVLVQLFLLLQEFLYQKALEQVQQFDQFQLSQSFTLQELLSLAIDHPDAEYDEQKHQPKDKLV